MRRLLTEFIGIIAATFMLAALVGCGNSAGDSIVQVWRTEDQPEAFGVIVGDGSQVLTVVDYELYNAGDMKVMIPGLGYYNATFQDTDSRTGATLLKLEGIIRTPVVTGDASKLTDGENLLIKGWTDSSLKKFTTTPVLVSQIPPDLMPLAFNVGLPQDSLGSGPVVNDNGAAVTDKGGVVFGVESIYTHRLVIRLGPRGIYLP